MLRELTIRSFKAFSRADAIPLQPLTVLIGANGSGKSTILQAVEMLGGLVQSSLSEYLNQHGWTYADLPHLLAPGLRFGFSAAVELEGVRTTWELEFETRRRPGLSKEIVTVGGEMKLERHGRSMSRVDVDGTSEGIVQSLPSSWLSAIEPAADAERFPALASLAAWARGIRGYFFLDPRALRGSSRESADDIGRAGEKLVGFLGYLERKQPDRFERIIERVQKYYRPLRGLHVTRGKYGWGSLRVTETWGNHQAAFNARQVSDGLLRLLAVAAMHELPETATVLLLDEVENGLHPALVGSFIGLLQDLVDERQGHLQILMTTHSPLALDYVRHAEQVLVVRRAPDGSATCKPLSTAKNYAKLREHFDLGELWYNVGEPKLFGE